VDIARNGEFKLRYEVEQDENYLQVIPYVIVKCGDKYFITERLGGDHRLKGMTAFVGGHIDSCDKAVSLLDKNLIAPEETIMRGIARELFEEINLCQIESLKCVGTFVDNRQPVSRVHICALIIAEITELTKTTVHVKELDKLKGKWVSLDELKELMDSGKMEGWAEIATFKLLNNKL
jgi:predicted NUDIX family phosphoesterase